MLVTEGRPSERAATGAAIVTALHRYPIKSCAGTALDEVEVEPTGFRHDRELLIVEAATGRFLTQREAPRLALIAPRIAAGILHAAAPGAPELTLAIRRDGPAREVVVWRDRCRAIDQGDEAARWLGDFLGVECRLVRLAEDFVRAVTPEFARDAADRVGFADGFPFLVIAEESLADLNGRLDAPLPMDRFRPNIVVAGWGAPFVEDRVRRFRIGGVVFHVVKPCARCTITTVDQGTAARGREPLTTLATYRRVERGVLFGQNLIHEGGGTIRRGDRVEVLAWRAEPAFW